METKLKCLRFVGTERNIGGVVLRTGDEIALDESVAGLEGGSEGLRAPLAELDRFVGDYPAEFHREYEKPKTEREPTPVFVPASAKEEKADESAVPEPRPPAAKRGV